MLLRTTLSYLYHVYYEEHTRSLAASNGMHSIGKRAESKAETITFGILIPLLVLLSGVFAGLTLGYMSLDETQLVRATSSTLCTIDRRL